MKISHELRRNAATRSGGLEYRASTAQWHAERSDLSTQTDKLALNRTLRTFVEQPLAGVVTTRVALPFLVPLFRGRAAGMHAKGSAKARAWSPEQIARRLPIDFQDDKTMRISHEAIF